MFGELPPSSNESFLRLGAAVAMMAFPVADSPVKVMASTSGWATSASPASAGPKPWTRLNTPSGRPASRQISASSVAVTGDCSAGFATTVQP